MQMQIRDQTMYEIRFIVEKASRTFWWILTTNWFFILRRISPYMRIQLKEYIQANSTTNISARRGLLYHRQVNNRCLSPC